MNILGIHAALNQFNHDPGAALIEGNQLVGVCEEERFNRVKSARGYFPIRSIRALLKMRGMRINDIDAVYTAGVTARQKLEGALSGFFEQYFGYVPKLVFVDHQDAHLASAYYCSKFQEAMCISYDGVGDGKSGRLAVGKGQVIEVVDDLSIAQSLGNFYSAMTAFLGFKPVEDEYKVMGLASYGQPGVDLSGLVDISSEEYSFNSSYFQDLRHLLSNDQGLFNKRIEELLGLPRLMGEPIEQRHMNIAYAGQRVLEDCILSLVAKLHSKTGQKNLCIAGGVGLNCSANARVSSLPFLDKIFIQPASSDRGLPLGAALIGQTQYKDPFSVPSNLFFGPAYDDDQIRDVLQLSGVNFREVGDAAIEAASLLTQGKIIGWFQGRSEYGPRALGNRSILADPRDPQMKDKINSRVKFREEFRPFAPVVLEEQSQEIFHMSAPSPFMTATFKVKEEWVEKLGAVTHVDGTARVQTVKPAENKKLVRLVSEFARLTQVPVVLNTSFNARGEPIVETPANALATFFSVGIDVLFIEDYMVTKDSVV